MSPKVIAQAQANQRRRFLDAFTSALTSITSLLAASFCL